MIWSGPGVGDAEGVTDLTGAAGLLAVGTEDGAGLWPNAVAASKNEMAVAALRFNIALLLAARRAKSNIAPIMTAIEMNARCGGISAVACVSDG